ncbi:MAG: L-threonylcarbamoyladenylate synthase [Pseudomonadota bacterium]
MTETTTQRLKDDPAGLAAAVDIWRAGGCVAFPTETVYGLGADARNDQAVAKVYAAKGRPSFNPLIVHVPDVSAVEALCHLTDSARQLVAAFWPGALTVVLPVRPDAGVSKLVTAGLETLAVRVPDHGLAQRLLASFGGAIAAPSANPSGRISPTTAAHVLDGLSGQIDAVMDGGACKVGLESTIVSCVDTPRLLRAGGIPVEALEACLGQPMDSETTPTHVQAPGQLASHYAPRGTVRLNVVAPHTDEVLLGFGPVESAVNLSSSGDMIEAAAQLFACLHQLDAMGASKIAVSPIPEVGLGRAINDRLRRAAAPRQ